MRRPSTFVAGGLAGALIVLGAFARPRDAPCRLNVETMRIDCDSP